jgi:hypothetical protein
MEATTTGVFIAAVIGLLSGVITLVVLPMIAYIQRRRDKDFDAIVTKVDNLEKKDVAHDVALTALTGKLETVQLIHVELREMRASMLSRAEFEQRFAALEREIRESRRT